MLVLYVNTDKRSRTDCVDDIGDEESKAVVDCKISDKLLALKTDLIS